MSQEAAKECAYGRNANETNEQFRSLHEEEGAWGSVVVKALRY
jgi:hypothetical protein